MDQLKDSAAMPGHAKGEADAASASPAPFALADRDRWLEAMADMHEEFGRKYEGVMRRLARIERQSFLRQMPEEVKGLLVMLTLYVGIAYVLPMIGDLVIKWRQQQS